MGQGALRTDPSPQPCCLAPWVPGTRYRSVAAHDQSGASAVLAHFSREVLEATAELFLTGKSSGDTPAIV